MISSRDSAVADSKILKEYFKLYITDVKGRKLSTAKHYLDALKKISNILHDKRMLDLDKDIYEVDSVEQLDRLWNVVSNDPEFVQLNERGDHMYSAGFNHYRDFASGQEFQQLHDKLTVIDKPMSVAESNTREYHTWKRSGILRGQAIEYAGYCCEIDENHKTFLAASNNKPYMEAHHIIPLHLQENFQYSLDVYANIICLCPLCHRQIHYGVYKERREMLDAIFEQRKDRLNNSGILMDKGEFMQMILSE